MCDLSLAFCKYIQMGTSGVGAPTLILILLKVPTRLNHPSSKTSSQTRYTAVNMIAGKAEELIALLQSQRILSYSGWNNLNITAITPLVLIALGLLFMIDYGYMIYLHFRMVIRLNSSTAQRLS